MSNKHPSTNIYRITNNNSTNIFPNDFLYLDANPIIDIISPNSNQNGPRFEQYIQDFAGKAHGLIVWSNHTVDEVRNYIHTSEYIKYAKNNGIQSPYPGTKDWKFVENTLDPSNMISLNQTVDNTTNDIFRLLEQYGEQFRVNDEIIEKVSNHLYINYGGNYPDAKHVAIANALSINCILSNDIGLARYPNLNLFGLSKQIQKESNNQNKLVDPVDYLEEVKKADDETAV